MSSSRDPVVLQRTMSPQLQETKVDTTKVDFTTWTPPKWTPKVDTRVEPKREHSHQKPHSLSKLDVKLGSKQDKKVDPKLGSSKLEQEKEHLRNQVYALCKVDVKLDTKVESKPLSKLEQKKEHLRSQAYSLSKVESSKVEQKKEQKQHRPHHRHSSRTDSKSTSLQVAPVDDSNKTLDTCSMSVESKDMGTPAKDISGLKAIVDSLTEKKTSRHAKSTGKPGSNGNIGKPGSIGNTTLKTASVESKDILSLKAAVDSLTKENTAKKENSTKDILSLKASVDSLTKEKTAKDILSLKAIVDSLTGENTAKNGTPGGKVGNNTTTASLESMDILSLAAIVDSLTGEVNSTRKATAAGTGHEKTTTAPTVESKDVRSLKAIVDSLTGTNTSKRQSKNIKSLREIVDSLTGEPAGTPGGGEEGGNTAAGADPKQGDETDKTAVDLPTDLPIPGDQPIEITPYYQAVTGEQTDEEDPKDTAAVQEQADVYEIPSTTPARRCGCNCSRRTIHILLCLALLLLGLGAAAAVVILLGVFDSDDDTVKAERDAWADMSPSAVIATIPLDICNEWIPGGDKSQICSKEQTQDHGGGLCNIVAQAFLSRTPTANITIINAGLCLTDFPAPELNLLQAYNALEDHELVTVAMSGAQIRQVLEDAMEASFGENKNASSYPYAAGLQWDVYAALERNERVSKVNVGPNVFGSYNPIFDGMFYTVVTTRELASGMTGYYEFARVIERWVKPLPRSSVDTFLAYVVEEEELLLNPRVDYSTNDFLPADLEPGIAVVSTSICLEWTPGAGKSEICETQASSEQGGGVCNLVAWAFLDQDYMVDISLLPAGDCAGDIPEGKFTLSDAAALLPDNRPLVTLPMTGAQIVNAIEQGLEAALGPNKRDDKYPYPAGIRFTANAVVSAVSLRASNVEFFRNSRWSPINLDQTYTVLTTMYLATGLDKYYPEFQKIDSALISEPSALASQAMFIHYIGEWGVLFDPPRAKYSTQTINF
jgi:2',3'-cyclic-nucleotide 2'-phosphodiesterase (5'-nucleotidase family)